MRYLIDNDLEVLSAKSLAEAKRKAQWLKRSSPHRLVYVSKVTNTPNGELVEVVEEC